MTKRNANKTTVSTTPSGKDEDGFIRVSLVNQGVFVRKRKTCPLKEVSISEINYKNLKLLNKFLSERGKIVPARITGVAMKKQKAIAAAVKRARQLALISPIKKD